MTPFADTGCDIVAAPQRPGVAGTTDERAVGSWAGRKVCMKATKPSPRRASGSFHTLACCHPLEHLTDELILGESSAYPIECRATLAPFTRLWQLRTLLTLNHQCPWSSGAYAPAHTLPASAGRSRRPSPATSVP